jgi:hypothetical protein
MLAEPAFFQDQGKYNPAGFPPPSIFRGLSCRINHASMFNARPRGRDEFVSYPKDFWRPPLKPYVVCERGNIRKILHLKIALGSLNINIICYVLGFYEHDIFAPRKTA